MSKSITPAERRHLDYLRRKGLKVGAVYEKRLLALRRKELRRVLAICRNYDDVTQWRNVIQNSLSESSYIYDWYKGLFLTAGLPHAQSVARDLSRGKAADPGMAWESMLTDYAATRAGHNIAIVGGTYKDQIIQTLDTALQSNINMSIQALTEEIYSQSALQQVWQCRRIAQTEAMIGMAEAGAAAAATLDVRFVKQWAISGIGNTRDTHAKMDGVTVDGQDYFVLPDCRMLYPHDTSLNPPAGEIINCACDVIRRPK